MQEKSPWRHEPSRIGRSDEAEQNGLHELSVAIFVRPI